MTGDIQIYGGIGTERNEISFENVKAQLDAQKSSTELAVHIVSPGGDVFEGEAIYNLLKNSGKKITTYIEGTCASIATLIAAAGDKIIMNETGRFMIHNPKISGLNTQADARDLQHIAMQLDKIKTLLVDVYVNKTGIPKAEMWELYDNETWMTSAEAKQKGFVDETVDAIKAVAKVDLKKMHMKDQSILSRIENGIKALASILKVKNEMMETLEDGRVIVVMSEDEDWTGKPVMLEDGMPLDPGDYTLQSGKVITVGEGSVISTVQDPEAKAQTQDSPEDMKKIEELEAKLAEVTAAKEAAEAALAQSQAATTTATAKATRLEAKFNDLSKEFLTLKEEASKTIGSKEPVKKGPVIKNISDKVEDYDPMGEMARSFYKQRNLIHDED